MLRPFIGSALAVIVYFAVLGGLISGNAGAGELSPYGLSALAGLTGMFSKQGSADFAFQSLRLARSFLERPGRVR